MGLNQKHISEIIGNSNFTKIDNDWKNGKPIPEIAEYYGFDIIY